MPSVPVRLSILLFIAWAAVLCAVGTGNALVVKSATVTRDPKKGDRFTVKGEIGDLAIDGSSAVSIDFAGIVTGFRTSELKRKKQVLSFKGVSGAPGLSQLVIDLGKRRFSAKGTGMELPDLATAVVVRLGADRSSECALLPLARTGKPPKPGAKPKAIHFKVPRGQHAAPCLVGFPVDASPHAVVVDVPTSVHVEATLAAGVAVDAGTLQLFAADAGGFPTGSPLCTLADDGAPASGDLLAANGVYTCSTTITQAGLGTLALVVRGTVAGVTLRSPPLSVYVVAPPSDADLTTVLDVETQAGAIWEAQSAVLGDTLNARLATVRALRLLAGVADADLAANGDDIVMRFTSGEIGGLMLSRRFGDAEPAAALTRQSAARASRAPASTVTSADSDVTAVASAALATCPGKKDRNLVGSLKGVILKTSYFPDNDDWPLARQAIEDSCLDLQFTLDDLTVASLLDLAPYSTIIISTHGIIGQDGLIGIVLDETATLENFHEYRKVFTKDELYPFAIPPSYDGGGRAVYIATAKFLKHVSGKLDDAFVYASHCYGDFEPSEADAFIALGAKAFLGYDNTVSTVFARITARTMLPSLVEDFLTTGDAYDQATKIDPVPRGHLTPVKGLKLTPGPRIPAILQLVGDHDLAYVGAPKMSPESITIDGDETTDLSVDVARTSTCDLVYDWSTPASVGTLSDDKGHQGASFQTTAAEVTYTAGHDESGSDTVNVGVRSPGQGDGPGPVFASACSVVEVGVCGDDVKQSDEECDGTDSPDCPGVCQLDCKCPPNALQIVFTGKGKWRQTVNGVTYTAAETWTVHYTYDIYPDDNGFPQSPGAGTSVVGTSSIVGSLESDCNGPIVVNTSHGTPTDPTPLFWTAPGGAPRQIRFVFDTFGGYDYRLCDGESNTLVGGFTSPPPGFPTYNFAIGFADVLYKIDDWLGAAPHTQTFAGLGASEVAAPTVGTADACWNGTVQLSTDGAAVPSLDDVPEPDCF